MNLLDPLATGILNRPRQQRPRGGADFDAFCRAHDVTPSERQRLIIHLVTIRTLATHSQLSDPHTKPGATP